MRNGQGKEQEEADEGKLSVDGRHSCISQGGRCCQKKFSKYVVRPWAPVQQTECGCSTLRLVASLPLAAEVTSGASQTFDGSRRVRRVVVRRRGGKVSSRVLCNTAGSLGQRGYQYGFHEALAHAIVLSLIIPITGMNSIIMMYNISSSIYPANPCSRQR